MSKTDKELTVELLTTYISAWNSADRTSAINFEELQSLIKMTHKTIQALPKDK